MLAMLLAQKALKGNKAILDRERKDLPVLKASV